MKLMHRMRLVFSVSLLPAILTVAAHAQTLPAPISYPSTARGEQVDDYHGTKIPDPYRWLEDTDSPETKAWVAAQNRVTFAYLAGIPEREAIRARLTQVWNYPKYSVPSKAGKRLFYTENSGLLNQAILFVSDGDKPARVLLDPNTLSADGTVAISTWKESPNGRYLAYGVSLAGSDWQEFRVRDVETGRDTQDTLKWVKFSGMSWTKDNRGFFYSAYERPASGNTLTSVNRNQRLYYHKLGTPQSADLLIFDRKDKPDWLFDATVTDDGTFAIITVFEGTDPRTRIYYIFLDNPKRPQVNAPVVRLIDRLEAEYEFVHNTGDHFLMRTDLGAPRGRLVQIDIMTSQPNRWVTVIPEGKDALQSARVAGNTLVLSYLQDARSSLRLYGMPRLDDPRRTRGVSGPSSRMPAAIGDRAPAPSTDRRAQSAPGYPFLGEITLPGMGTVGGISAKPDDNEMFYSFVSYLGPTAIYRYDVRRRTNEPFKTPR